MNDKRQQLESILDEEKSDERELMRDLCLPRGGIRSALTSLIEAPPGLFVTTKTETGCLGSRPQKKGIQL